MATDEPIPTLTDGVVVLRAALPTDLGAITRACQDTDSQRWTTALPFPYTEDDARWFVEESVPRDWANARAVTWAVTGVDEPQEWAGSMSVRLLDREDDLGDVGYLTAPWARGQGWTTRALTLACRFGFGPWRLDRLEWRALIGNDASRRVAEKVGFRFEGVQRSRLVRRGERLDAWSGALLPQDLA